MIDIIDRILVHHGFKLDDNTISFGKFYTLSERDDCSYYWLVVNVDNIGEVLENQDQWFEECKEKLLFPDFNKNTSLLVLNQYQEDFEEWRKKVYTVEQDPYQFKKYVLRYTDEIVSELKENSSDGNTEELIKLMTNEDVFSSYKDSHKLGEYSWYDLLFGIANKLPFLNLGINKANNLASLFDDTKIELENRNLLDDFNDIEDKFTDEVLVKLDNIELEGLLTILKGNDDE